MAARTLTAWFVGAPSGTGPCTADYHLEIAESATAVAVAEREYAHGGNVVCSAVEYPRHATTVLAVPLAARVVVDAVSRAAEAVTEATPEAEPNPVAAAADGRTEAAQLG